jgi:phosphonate transport system substrate-binding protein
MKKFVLFATLLLLIVALAACAAPTPTPSPVPPTAVPAPATKAPEPTKPPAPTATTAPTAVPATKPPEATKPPAPTATTAPTQAAGPAAPKCDKLASAMTPKAGDLGSADKPIVITFVPSVDVGLITKGGTAMADCLTKMTGLTFKIEVGTSETASVEAMGGNKAQFGFLNTFAVLLAKEKYDVDVLLVAQRKYGVLKADKTYTAFDFDPDKALAGQLTSYYKPEYFTKAGSGIKSLADMKGKSFCFTTASSTSGGIIPRAVFKAMGIDPDKDMKSSYAGGHDKAAISVYDGTCDAGVAFMDVLTDSATNLAGKFPDIAQKVQVFAVGDRIPNDGLQMVKGLDPKIRDITVEALMAMMADPGGNAVVKGIYNYDAFEKADYAKYYGPFNETLKKAGINVADLVRK